ncbi:MAG: Ig-like domain-containing protein, partial [archaeon]
YYKINGSQFETTTNPKSVEISSEGENSLEFWAKDSYGNEGTHITTSVKIDNTSPNAPSLNSPGASSNGEVSLSWSKPADNPSSANSGIKEYKIYRKTGSENYAVIHTETNPDTLSYTDTGRSQGTTYYYKVTAFDNLNTESDLTNSNEQSVTMPSDSTITTNSGDSVAPSLSWSAPKDGDTITDINVTLKAFASDTSTLQYVSFTFKKETESSYTAITSFQDNLLNGYKTTVWNTSGLENGKYNLKVLARDSPGNVSTKVITVTLNRENIGEKPVEEKPEELVITENMIQEAKDSKTEAMDLISYWKKFNIDFSGDTTIKEANALLEKAEEEMNANNLFASMKDANNSKKLFEAFSSNTKIKVYNSSTTENKEISLSGNLSKENTELKKEISVSREIQFIEVTDGNNTFYQQNIVLTIKNSSDKAKTFKAVELIPKELIENTDSIKSSYAFSVIEKDPVIEWNITLKAGEEKQIVYSLDKKLTKAEADKIIASGNLELFEGNTVLAGEKTKINSNSFKAATTGFISLDSILPIGAGIIVIVILIGIFFFFKGRNSGNGSAKKNEAGSDGLISIYSESPKNGKITLREELNNNKRITPDRNGRFSFKED